MTLIGLASLFMVAAGSNANAAVAADPPSARSYWQSSPNLASDTLTIAGSFPPTAKSVRVCTDVNRGGCRPAADVEMWSQSVKARLPDKLSRPLWLEVGGDTTNSTELRVAINEPDVWFTAILVDGLPVDQSGGVPTGAVLRTFGRALAWAGPGGMECIDARSRTSAQSVDSSLLLTRLASTAIDAGSVINVLAQNASCYEAAFSLDGVAPGRYAAVVQTEWGSSRAWMLTIAVSTEYA